MNKEVAKRAVESAEKELEQQQVERLKDIVKRTLLKIKDLDAQIDQLQENRKILKLDIDDLKDGHLDRIEERQRTDEKAKKVSIVVIEKEVHHHHNDWWYQPYKITYVPYTPPVSVPSYPAWCNTLTFGNCSLADIGNTANSTSTANNLPFTLNASIAKNNVVGTYSVNGSTVHLR